ncbi:hypothetical protein KR009_008253 [Drosophila setifemur]|nr:hypothetical protein KR009_008253 [Drosophila setifemur]
MPGFIQVEVKNNMWEIPDIYEIVQPLSAGAFGQVAKAQLRGTTIPVAIKKLLRPFRSDEDAKMVYREIRLLKHMDHRNVIGLLDTFHSPWPSDNQSWDDFTDVYLVTQFMERDLHSVTRNQKLSDSHVKKILYQILRGLKYIHSAGVLHRDLKPGNIAVNADCELRILDFGMARLTSNQMTDTVCTLWYRAPEVLFCWDHYTSAIDMWSVGCILAELISGKALFPGKNHLRQLRCVIDIMGTPSDEFISRISNPNASNYVKTYPLRERCNFQEIFPSANPLALDLLEKMLKMMPDRRITAEEAMNHPFFEDFSKPLILPNEDTAPPYDQNFEDIKLSVNCWKELILNEIKNFKPRTCFMQPLYL